MCTTTSPGRHAWHPPYRTLPNHIVPYQTISFHTLPYRTIPYHIIPHLTIPYHVTPHRTVAAQHVHQRVVRRRRGPHRPGDPLGRLLLPERQRLHPPSHRLRRRQHHGASLLEAHECLMYMHRGACVRACYSFAHSTCVRPLFVAGGYGQQRRLLDVVPRRAAEAPGLPPLPGPPTPFRIPRPSFPSLK